MSLIVAVPATGQSTGPTERERALQSADSLRAAGAFLDALNRLSGLQEQHPDAVPVLWRLAYTQADLGRRADGKEKAAPHYEKALEAANAAVAADSTSAHAHLATAIAEGRIALDAGTRERAQRSRAIKHHADRAIALDSTLAGAYHVRGRWHRGVADLGFFERAIVRTMYGGLPDGSFEQSVRDFRQALALEAEPLHHLELGKTYLKMDRPDEARAQLQMVLDVPADDPFEPQYREEARSLLKDLD
jgi:tetratricopeptide (TPR) repeat protein